MAEQARVTAVRLQERNQGRIPFLAGRYRRRHQHTTANESRRVRPGRFDGPKACEALVRARAPYDLMGQAHVHIGVAEWRNRGVFD